MISDFPKLLDFYRAHTYRNLMAYWMKRVDREHGGLLNCQSNRGDRLLHEHKFVWSQGRWAWTAARLYQDSAGHVPERTRREYLRTARDTAHFLMRHARLENGNCAFVLSREGRPVRLADDGTARPARRGEVYDYSISADIFAYYGAAEYARVSGERAAYDWAKDLFLSCERRGATGTARNDYPYPTPKGYRTHGSPMGAVEMCQELAKAADRFADRDFAARLRGQARDGLRRVLGVFVQPDNLVLEMLGFDDRPVDTLLGRYCNPGHTIEDMWFILHQAMELGSCEIIARAAAVTRATCERAWDRECGGGIPQFMDRHTGRQPSGPIPPELAKAVMVWKVRNLWDKKLWWPHSEALYTLLLVHELTGEGWAMDWYRRFHEYTFKTFPNPDRRVGEWIQIRDRRGRPESAVVALPVKDPMHIARAFQHAINCLQRLSARH